MANNKTNFKIISPTLSVNTFIFPDLLYLNNHFNFKYQSVILVRFYFGFIWFARVSIKFDFWRSVFNIQKIVHMWQNLCNSLMGTYMVLKL